MNIETAEDLANTVADWLGCYGGCKAATQGKDECNETDPHCCRVGFMMTFPDRMRAAVENEKKLQQLNLITNE